LQAGIAIGLRGNIHADELHPLKGAELAAELKVVLHSIQRVNFLVCRS
jgi:hypothetical protein